jgi:alpha-mannosidase
MVFQTLKHEGALGRNFSMIQVKNPRIRILAVKKAEHGDEIIVRLVELEGKPQSDVRVSFAAAITDAREVNGQEQPIGPATVASGALITSFGAYQPRTFAVRLAAPAAKAERTRSIPVALSYNLAAASNDGDHSTEGFDGKGNALPTEMLPAQIVFNDVLFQLARTKAGAPNAEVARGQAIDLPSGHYNRVYLLAASDDGDQRTTFEIGDKKVELSIQDWSGYIGQWDNRQWSALDTSHDNYGEMTGLKPGFIKRADLAWYCSHHHNAAGQNVAYAYSYLFGYAIDLPPAAKTIRLPNNERVRILAISLADENPEVRPARPLYDVLPSPNAGPDDFALSVSSAAISVPQGKTATTRIIVMPRGSFNGKVNLAASGLPAGVTAAFSPAGTTGISTMTLTTSRSTPQATTAVTVTGVSGSLSHTFTTGVAVTPVLAGTVAVDLSSAYNVTGIYRDGSTFAPSAGLDHGGYALSEQALGPEQVGDGVVFRLGPANAPDAVTGGTVALPAGKFSSLKILAVAVEGNQGRQTFTVNYADGTSSSFIQSLTDWAEHGDSSGESVAAEMPYRLTGDGSKDANTFYAHAYSFILDSSKVAKSVNLPGNANVLLLAATLVPSVK